MTGDPLSALAAAFLVTIGISSVRAEIRISIAALLTGAMAWGGEQTRAGAHMALEDLNAAGGIRAQAVERAGTTDATRVAEALREEQFDTVLGEIGFDAKGDVTGFDPFVWTDGTWMPQDPIN